MAFECDSCAYVDDIDEEPDLCPVCGEFRWSELNDLTSDTENNEGGD